MRWPRACFRGSSRPATPSSPRSSTTSLPSKSAIWSRRSKRPGRRRKRGRVGAPVAFQGPNDRARKNVMASGKGRSRVVYVCQQCSAQSLKWAGRCTECGAWNSLLETVEEPSASGARSWNLPRTAPVSLSTLRSRTFDRIVVPGSEFNRAVGGGIVPGSLVLLGGDPGIGKSTLLLQVSADVAQLGGPVLYVSGEESAEQIKLRADRLGIETDNLLVLAETRL